METIFHTPDPWTGLRTLTEARIALGRTGGSLPTAEVLDFRLAHAAARDAVLTPFDPTALADEILALGTGVFTVTSAAANRAQYLQRPDSGRQLSAGSRAALTDFAAGRPPVDLVVIAADGLSTQAVRQIVPLLRGLLPALQGAGWELAPVIVASQARVALQAEIGTLLQARLSLRSDSKKAAEPSGLMRTLQMPVGTASAQWQLGVRQSQLRVPLLADEIKTEQTSS